MSSIVCIVFLLVLVEGSHAGMTSMHRIAGMSADIARINCLGFPTDLLPSDRPLTMTDLATARDAALAILAARVGVPIPSMTNETIVSTDNVGVANRGLCDVNILLWLLPWPVCRVQSPPPRPAPVDAVREEIQRCY